MTAADLDFDGRVTAQEFATRADQRFASLDAAGAGRLTLADLMARTWAQRGPRGGSVGGDRGPGGGGAPPRA